jgi:prepilin-type N-terminal cleavage/methylation domain-containing protein
MAPVETRKDERTGIVMIDTNSGTQSTRQARRLRAAFASADGFTLFEVLIATVILAVGLTALLGLLDVTVKASSATKTREGATNLAREIVEDGLSIPYAQLSPSSIVGQLQAMNGLADASSAAGWQVVRRGVTYTATVSDCSIDEPKDGSGKHDNTFCKDPGEEEGTLDPSPADLKRITVDVTWSAQGRTGRVHQVGTLTAAGAAPGLSASELRLALSQVAPPSEATAPVVTQSVSPLVFYVTSPAGTAAMTWSLEGSTQSTAPTLVTGTETEWTFTWPISGLSDGTYQVSAQAIDTTGVVGPPVSISVTLIRGQPAAPKGILGGFNTINVGGTPTKVVELKWQANAERNVIGYRVYRPGGEGEAGLAGGELAGACPGSLTTLSLTLSCIDFNPPKPNAANLTYSLAALYRDAEGKVQQGPSASFTVAGGASAPPGPNEPKNLKAEKNANGSVTLTWEKPSGGPAVIFYRVYRGSTDYTSRFDVTPSGEAVTYTDDDAVTPHTYWVTAVDANLTESSFSNSASG